MSRIVSRIVSTRRSSYWDSRSTSTLSPLVSYDVSEEEDVQDCYDSAFKQAYLAAWIMSLMFLWDYAAYATQERNVNIFNTTSTYRK